MPDTDQHDPRVIGLFRLADGEPTGDPPRTWIQVMIAGRFKHPRYGDFAITVDDLHAYAADITERGDRIPIDFDHQSAGGKTEAAGWYTGQTRVGQDTQGREALFAEVEFTPGGADAVRSRRYRFISPEFSRTFRDSAGKLIRKPRMWATALTNRPFLPDMDPVTLSEFGVADRMRANLTIPLAMRETLAAKLGVDDLDLFRLAEWATAFINDLPDSSFLHVEAGGTKDADGKTTPRSLRHFPVRDAAGKLDLPHLRNALARIPQSTLPAPVKARLQGKARRLLAGDNQKTTDQGDTMNPEILKLLGLPEDATDEQITAAITQRDEKVAELDAKVKELSDKPGPGDVDRVAALEAQLAGERIRRCATERDTVLAQAVREGRILPAQKGALVKAFGGDTPSDDTVTGLREFVAFAPADTVPMRARGGDSDRPDNQQQLDDARRDNTVTVAGATYIPDDRGLEIDLHARKLLADRGKTSPTADEYIAACEEAAKATA
ncbi:MAG: hypothetical protein KJ058_00470 [Thermoanaerobaculia bacterium]|nr:hypothetical protein [Thermoanaerobaculia bacterium]